MKDVNIAYIAGLFDGEGTVGFYKRYETKKDRKGKPRKSLCNRISVEISMTERSVLLWMYELLKIGSVTKKPRKKHKMQWRWRCSFRQAYYFCCLIYPYCHIKIHKVQKIIDHYSSRKSLKFNGKVVSLEEYKEAMSLE